MTDSGDSPKTGRKLDLVFGVVWVGLGFSAIEVGDMWRGAAGVALGVMWGSMYWWADSAVGRFMTKPIFTRKKKTEELSAAGRG